MTGPAVRDSAPAVAYVLGTTEGGTGRHVGMLARGCVAAGFGVGVFGPAETRGSLGPGLGSAGDASAGKTSAGEAPACEASALEVAAGQARFWAVPISDRPRPATDVAAVRRLRRLLAAMAPAVVHAHGLRAGALAALALRPLPGFGWPAGRAPALVVTVHNAPPAAAAAAAVYGLLERLVARRADVVLCVSSDLEMRMRRLGAARVDRAVVPAPPARAADPAGQDAPTAGLPAAGRPVVLAVGRPVVLAVGRLAAQKGFETLIAAAADWRNRQPAPLLVIAGTGPLAADLARQARDLGTSVSFLGWRDDVAALLAAADVFVLPSRWEGQPLIVQEALRAGRPIVGTDVGGVRDLTGDEAAVLVPPGDPAALAGAVLRVLDDPGLARRLGSAAAARATALPTEADAIEAVLGRYEELAAGADAATGPPR